MGKIWISAFREIKETFGRYLALLLIIGLGVGFFAGLKVTDPAMREAMHKYLTDNEFFDYRLISSLGFEEQDIDYLKENVDARAVEASISFDIIVDFEESSEVVKVISIPSTVNKIVLEEGSFPVNNNECLVDSYLYDSSIIGKELTLSNSNEQDDLEHFAYGKYKVVGLVKSPLFIQYERGTTTLGSGVLDGFMYINAEGFDVDYYTDCYVKLDSDPMLYSDEYDDLINSTEASIETSLDDVANNRYERIVKEATDELNDAKQELADEKAKTETELNDAKAALDDAAKSISDYEALEDELKAGLDEMLANLTQMEQAMAVSPELVDMNQYNALLSMYQENTAKAYTLHSNLENARSEYNSGLEEYNDGLEEFNEKISDAEAEIADAQKDIDDIEDATTYVLKRDSNVGYVCFESDSTIVGSIANVFPVFFFLVAALVCMTTMNRMVEDQRTQIGVLKALGYSNHTILGKFIFYSGSAAFIGTTLGFIAGTIAFPKAIWYAYQMMYNTSEVDYYFSITMLIISILVAFVCSVGVTFISCSYEMGEMAASLMRPKAPKAGKRIFLEYITFFWNRLKFLKKVSLRNIFRYKGRLFMMVLGIGGCTALLVAGFGIYDSIADIAQNQFANVSKYDIDITLKNSADGHVRALEDYGYTTDDYLLYYHTSVDMHAGNNTKNVYLNVFEDDANINKFFDLHDSRKNPIDFESLGDDEVILNIGLADRYNVSVGDTITLSSDSISPAEYKVAAINENFIYNYIFMNRSAYENIIGSLPEKKNVYLNIKEGEDAHIVGADLMENKDISVVSANVDMLERVDSMMESLNIIVYLVIGCAMALAAVVVYNLTHINISERVREIATVKVLGFYKEETRAYVFRENIILAVMGAALGLLLGKLLHLFIMSEIVVDLITFDVRITVLSYSLAFVLTIIFTFIINLLMGKKLDNISMTESLKAVE